MTLLYDGKRPANIGVLAIEVYTPTLKVDQEILENAHGVPGKYTIGLGQVAMTCCNDREDAVSMALSVVSSLLKNYDVDASRIGRLEVGTESGLDRSKSIKSHLMQLFLPSGNTNIEGVDCMHGCYGATAALFNSVAWVESSAWDGRLALVVASDVAMYPPDTASSATGGCGAVALLVGRDAPLVLDSNWRASYSCHAYEFFKPSSVPLFPVVDGPTTVLHFLNALDNCAALLHKKLKPEDGLLSAGLEGVDWYVSHAPFNKLVRKGLGRVLLQDLLRSESKGAEVLEAGGWSSLNADSLGEASIQDKELEKVLMEASKDIYDQKVQSGAEVQQLCGNSYTACVYMGLASLIEAQGASAMQGTRTLMFSFGSGVCASMFVLEACGPYGDGDEFSLERIVDKLRLRERLQQRRAISFLEYQQYSDSIKAGFAAAPFVPTGGVDHIPVGAFYLEGVDAGSRRTYRQKAAAEEPHGSE